MNANIRHSSETPEHGSPPHVVSLARTVLGSIDLDPASDTMWNDTIRASCFFEATADGGGFVRPWFGNVWVNAPGGWQDRLGRRVIKASKTKPDCTVTGECGLPPGHGHDGCDSAQREWWCKTYREWASGNAKAVVFLCFSIEAFQTTQRIDGVAPMLKFPMCVPFERLKYTRQDGTVGGSPPHSSAIIMLPAHTECFECGSRVTYLDEACPKCGDNESFAFEMVNDFRREFAVFGEVR